MLIETRGFLSVFYINIVMLLCTLNYTAASKGLFQPQNAKIALSPTGTESTFCGRPHRKPRQLIARSNLALWCWPSPSQ